MEEPQGQDEQDHRSRSDVYLHVVLPEWDDLPLWFKILTGLVPRPAVRASLTVTKGTTTMPGKITVDSVGEQALLRFFDDHNEVTDAPAGAVANFAVADTTKATVAPGSTAVPDPGDPTATPPIPASAALVLVSPLTLLLAGDTSVSLVSLDDGAGNPVLETFGPNTGQPFPDPGTADLNILTGAAVGDALSIAP